MGAYVLVVCWDTCICSKYGFCIIMPEGIIDLSTPYNYVTCRNVIGRRIVMVERGVMYDISHPRQERAL